MKLHLFITTYLLLCLKSHCYSPVVLMHGIFDGPDTMNTLESLIKNAHPGTEVYKIDMFNNDVSLYKMWDQIYWIRKRLGEIMSTSNSTNFIGFSQGGVVGRALIQTTNNHNIETFISLSAPLNGEFGFPIIYQKYWPNATLEWLTDFFYSTLGQDISIGAYWHAPFNEDIYRKKSKFLAPLTYPTNPDWKNNFLKLKKLVMIGGPDDEVIKPWQSSQFGFFGDKEEILTMEQMDFFKNDTFGLQTLFEQNRTVNVTVANVFHTHWHQNKDIIEKYIIPNLN